MDHHPEVKSICAKAYLDYVRSLTSRIDTLQESIEQQRSVLLPQGINYREAVSQTSDIDALEKGIVQLQEMISDYCTELQEFVEQQRVAKCVLDRLSRHEYAIALTKYFLQGKTWEQVCVDMDYSYRGMMKLKRAALPEVYDLMPEQWRREPIPNAR